MKPAASRPAIAWIEREPTLARLGQHAARLAALQSALDRLAPGMALAVIALERDALVVGAPHAAVAARLRQMSPSLVAALAREGWRVDRIRFKPQWRPAPGVRRAKEVTPPGATAVAALASLAESVEDPRLRAALRRLARRHRPPDARDAGDAPDSPAPSAARPDGR